ncbi:MAG: hypothetical protein ACTHJQ_22630 [Rhizobiaceae bacterium]
MDAERKRASILYGVASLAFAIVMTGVHWFLTGINDQFGYGFAVGLFFAFGLLGILSKTVREIP